MKTAAASSIGASLQALAAPSPAAPQPQQRSQTRPLPTRPPLAAREAQPLLSARLTPRQLEVLALLCEGLPNKLICRQLNIATGTVKVHMTCILRELGVASRLQAVVVAQRLGLAGEPMSREAEYLAATAVAEQPGPATARLPLRERYREAVAF